MKSHDHEAYVRAAYEEGVRIFETAGSARKSSFILKFFFFGFVDRIRHSILVILLFSVIRYYFGYFGYSIYFVIALFCYFLRF